ncbi:hypothetical protein B0H19DRAFT_1321335 [Mycena capillaripes]|nr:hypothetical protein B0H19DRAFT_1321335 [Mycena capillaripes]
MSIVDYPTEVLLKIFHHAVGDEPLQLGGTAVALPISQVCRDWRQIVLDCPALWDDVRFPYGAYRSDTPMLENLLARSGTRPLTAVFSHAAPGRSGRMVDFWPLFKKMKEYCSRFRAIYAIMPTPGIYELNRALGRRKLPLLVHLHIVQSDNLAPVAVDFENAPALTAMHLERVSYSSFYRNTSTTLRSMRFAQVRFVDIPVPVMHGLHDLTIIRSPLPFFNHANPIPQLALESLTLDGITSSGYPDELLWFLTSSDMPRLRHIELANLDHKLQFSSQFVRALAPPAFYPALRTAKFTALPLSEITPEFCRALPGLETLVLVKTDPEPLLSLLRADPFLCPDLHEMCIDGTLRRR